jgi:hypothetical protein
MRTNYPDYKNSVLYFQAPYLSETLDIDIFNEKHYRTMHAYKNNDPRPAAYFILWDDWYSSADAGVSNEQLQADPELVHIKTFEYGTRKTILYKMK